MPFRSSFLRAVLALLASGSCLAPVSAQTQQTKAPARTAQRTPARDVPAAATDARMTKVAPREAADATPRPAGRPAPTAQQSQPPKTVVAVAPFELSESQQNLLNQLLIKWEKESDKIKTFKCTFTRWETDKIFGPKQRNYINSEAKGNLSYVAPDRGSYEVKQLEEWDAQKKIMVKKPDGFDHWMCDGKQIFEFDHRNKRLIVRDLPPEMQGKAISDGPLPFVFGAKAEALKLRYWMRDVTPREQVGKEVWLETWPKRQQDKANFHHATLILTDPDFKPFALQIFLPDGKNHADYAFEGPVVNDPLALFKGDFLPPRTPTFWKKVVNPESTDGPDGSAPPAKEPAQVKRPAPPANEPAQAKRPAAPTQRK